MAVDTGYLTTQVNSIIGQLHGIFDDIGVPDHERESRETEVRFEAFGGVLLIDLILNVSFSSLQRCRKH
jgi:hypothetical protein